MDALRSYEEQGWKDLAAQTRLELVSAAKKMNDVDRWVSEPDNGSLYLFKVKSHTLFIHVGYNRALINRCKYLP